MKKNYIYMWYISIAFLILALVFFAICILRYWNRYFGIIAGVFTVAFVIMFTVSSKSLRCKEGYTVIQAINFYASCLRAGYNNKSDASILESQAEQEGLEDLDSAQLMQCFRTGRNAVKSINSSILKTIWRIPKTENNKS